MGVNSGSVVNPGSGGGGGGAVSSVFGRSGSVMANTGDYTDAQITGSPTTVLTATGDILYASGAHTLARLPIGATGTVLTVVGGVPSWQPGVGYSLTFGSTGHTVTLGSGTWFTDVAYVYAADPNSSLALDIIPSGAGSWAQVDIFDRDIIALGSIANYETLQLRKYSVSSGSYPDLATISTSSAGTGGNRPLLLQQYQGGQVGIGGGMAAVYSSAVLEINTTGLNAYVGGLLFPRMTTATKNGLTLTAASGGCVVFDTSYQR